MKKIIPILICCCFSLFVRAQTTKKVLFLGNSYTEVNNLPQLTANIAASVGNTLIFDSYTPGGYTLQQHFTNATSIAKIKAGGWDYVVMQEQSQLPAFAEYNDNGAYNLSLLIRKHNPCARILFYMTWGRKNGDASNCAAWPPICTYKGMDSLLRIRYTEMAQFNETGLTPVGVVWRYIRENSPGIELYQTDESHPSLAGSYLAANCFYTSIFGKNPTASLYSAGLNGTDAATIRQAAKTVIFDSLQKWEYGKYIPSAKFTYTIGTGNNEVIFTNSSTNADSVIWDFGDGNFSSTKSPVHQYAAPGTYTIKLTAINCDLSVTHVSTKQLTISFCAHNPRIFPDNLVLCPNEKDTIWTQAYDSYQWLDEQGDIIPGETKQYFLPTGGHSYSVLARVGTCTEQSPPVFVQLFSSFAFYNVDTFGNFIAPDTLCMGDTLTFILWPNKPPYPEDSNIKWYRNGVLVSTLANDTIMVTTSGQYKVTLTHPACPNYKVYESPLFNCTFINCDSTSQGITDISMLGTIKLYPNPAGEKVQVDIPSSALGSNYYICDVFGKIILTGNLDLETNTLDLDGINSGVYILCVQNQRFKFVKE